MKKLLFLTLTLGALVSTSAYAQPAGDPPSVLEQMKEKQRPGLVEKAGLTEAQADKIIEINFEMRQSMMTGLRDLSDADRAKRIEEFKTARDKKYNEVLTPEQFKSVKAFYEDMGKNMPKKG